MQTNDNDDDDNGARDAACSTILRQNSTRFLMLDAPRHGGHQVSGKKQNA